MKIGLWNIDHPEYHPSSPRRHRRRQEIIAYLRRRHCDIFILTETNAAISLPGYHALLSQESPFHNRSRNYEPPNKYHQVGIYSRFPLDRVEISEPINGVLGHAVWENRPFFIYGNVITIKDRWAQDSGKTYADRLTEQLAICSRLTSETFVIGGDFNLRLGWTQKKKAYQRVKKCVNEHGLAWPTAQQTKTVQHIIHSQDIISTIEIDASVQHEKGKRNALSDHPFLLIDIKIL